MVKEIISVMGILLESYKEKIKKYIFIKSENLD